jgi:imidazolonepropionase-like amidohydrolase
MQRCLLLLGIFMFTLGSAAITQQPPTIAFVGGTIYPSPNASPIRDGAVIVERDKIVAVGPRRNVKVAPRATIIDCHGMFVVAGFQNSHVHFTPPGWTVNSDARAEDVSRQLEAMLTRWGFTTVIDTGSEPTSTALLKKRIESGEVKGPRILTAGLPLYPPKGLPYYLNDIPSDLLKLLPQPETPAAAAQIVTADLNSRDLVKLFVGSWVTRHEVLAMPQEIATAAAHEAHRDGKLVFAHPSNVAGLNVALAAGVDVLAHALDNPNGLTEAHLRRMKQQNMGMVPTLKLFQGAPEVIAEVRSFHDVGGQILFGTDVGYLADADPTVEYELMSHAGLTWRDIFASLTTNSAARFNESRQRGQLRSGMSADLVVLRRDPAQDVRAFSDVTYTMRGGRLVYRLNDLP